MINFKNVSFSYDNNLILNDISFTFPNSGLVIILGKSGSGKSTLLSLLNGTLLNQKGKIEIDGKISTIFQDSLLLDYLSVVENVMLPLLIKNFKYEKALETAKEALNKVNFQIDFNKSPMFLSGGEKMKVSIARALVTSSDILILDEPTGQLDDKNSQILYDLFKKLSKDKLLILVTHDEVNALKLADRLYILEDKKLKLIADKIKNAENKSKITNKLNDKKVSIKFLEAIRITIKFLKSKMTRVFLSAFFLSLTLTFLYLGLNLNFSVTNLTKNINDTFFASNHYKVQYKKTIAKENKISLDKYIIPDIEILSNLNIDNYYYSLSYFIPEYYSLTINQIESTVTFLPIVDDNYDDNKIIINSSFLKKFNLDINNKSNLKIDINRNISINSSLFLNFDNIDFNITFQISDVISEIELLNTPTIYYSYNYVSNYLSNIRLDNISKELNHDVYMSTLLEDKLYNQDVFKSNELYFVNDDIDNILKKAESIYKDKVIISSKKISFDETFNSIFTSMKDVFLLFLSLTILTASIFETLCVYSLYDENIRLFALIKVESKNKINSFKLFLANAFTFFLIAFVITSLFSFIANVILNIVLQKNNLSLFTLSFNFKALLITSILILFLSILSSFIPLKRINDKRIKDELQGEE